jgi:hypothetical protein
LLLVLASTVIVGSELHGTHDQILLSDGFGSIQQADSVTQFFLPLSLPIHRQGITATFLS